ncbi:hypothetical protein ACWCQN_47250 [Streptomyces sp. NPDC001984]
MRAQRGAGARTRPGPGGITSRGGFAASECEGPRRGVRPDDAETELNGYRLREPRRIDWERQAEIAERAFLANGFFMLAGDRQVEDLDEIVDLTVDPDLVFIKLVALVGG